MEIWNIFLSLDLYCDKNYIPAISGSFSSQFRSSGSAKILEPIFNQKPSQEATTNIFYFSGHIEKYHISKALTTPQLLADIVILCKYFTCINIYIFETRKAWNGWLWKKQNLVLKIMLGKMSKSAKIAIFFSCSLSIAITPELKICLLGVHIYL